MKLRRISLFISLVLSSVSSVQAITIEELASQFEAYKKQQALKFG